MTNDSLNQPYVIIEAIFQSMATNKCFYNTELKQNKKQRFDFTTNDINNQKYIELKNC